MSKLQNKQQKRKQIAESSSSSSSSSSDSDYDDDEVSSMDEKEVSSKAKYTKFLSKMYPSKHMSNKVKEQTKVKNSIISTKKSVCDKKKTNKKRCNKKGCDKKSKKESSSEYEESDSDSDSDYVDEDEDSESEESTRNKSKKSASVNIFLTVDDNVDDESWEDDDSWEDEDSDESEDEDEDVSVSSDDDDASEDTETITTPENNIDSNNQLLTTLLEIQDKNKNNKIINDCVETCKTKIQQFKKKQEKKQVKQKEKNQRIFKKILNNRKLQNEVVYFKKMPVEEQKVIIKELRAVNKIISVEKPYRLSLLESAIPIQFKSVAMKKINLLKSMDQYCSEYYKVKHWVDSFMRIPFGKYHNLEVTIQDGIESSHAFMENAKNILDSAVYGLNDAKMQIMQMLGQLITNPQAVGSAIAIKGPMGTGKTTLVKEGISKILNRPFAFIALGGATDSSFLEGHSYTYEGSIWGKIVQILMDSKCMNPVIYFDELDKISDTPKGEEIVGILTHLTDTSQNSQFHDKYFSEIDFDISKCLFIFSYNDESKVSPILRDRMYRIQTKGYDKKQKTIIANQYILPKIRDQVKFEPADIIISDDVIHYIIDNFCEKEDGVRNQKRCLEIIYTKLNLYRLMRPDSNLFEQEMSIKVTFPFQVTKQIVDKLIKTVKDDNMSSRAMYI
jgi:ATP-dependent Lon protease